jgi:hypothetical protein
MELFMKNLRIQMVSDQGKTLGSNKYHGILAVYKVCIDFEGKSDFKKGRMLGTTPLAHGAGQPKPKAQSQPSPRNRKGEASLERRVIDHYPKTELLFVGDVFKRQS